MTSQEIGIMSASLVLHVFNVASLFNKLIVMESMGILQSIVELAFFMYSQFIFYVISLLCDLPLWLRKNFYFRRCNHSI